MDDSMLASLQTSVDERTVCVTRLTSAQLPQSAFRVREAPIALLQSGLASKTGGRDAMRTLLDNTSCATGPAAQRQVAVGPTGRSASLMAPGKRQMVALGFLRLASPDPQQTVIRGMGSAAAEGAIRHAIPVSNQVGRLIASISTARDGVESRLLAPVQTPDSKPEGFWKECPIPNNEAVEGRAGNRRAAMRGI